MKSRLSYGETVVRVSENGATTLRCIVFGHKWEGRMAVGRMFDVCSRCQRSRTHVPGGES